MAKKARPGQGARRRAKNRAKAAKAEPDAIDSAKASALTRRQRITNVNERRKMANARLDQIEQTVHQTQSEAKESKKETDSWRFRTDLDSVDFKLSASNV